MLVPFGSVFQLFNHISITTADDISVHFRNTFLTRLVFRLIGIPHIPLRLRGRKIMQNTRARVDSMLDAGFGTGLFSFTLAHRVSAIDAIDADAGKVNYVKSVNNVFTNVRTQLMDLTDLTFADNSFDLIICSEVIEHIQKDDLAFFHLARVLKKNGTLLLTVPYVCEKNRLIYKAYHHERPGYTEADIRRLCDRNGLKIKKIEGFSYSFAEKLFEISRIFYNRKAILVVFFAAVYPWVLISEQLALGNPCGIFFKISKE
jgi:2-polyprenyl-3-methyl-5-hydroxy-6-metoxy-1,4-benzoquinol methylase